VPDEADQAGLMSLARMALFEPNRNQKSDGFGGSAVKSPTVADTTPEEISFTEISCAAAAWESPDIDAIATTISKRIRFIRQAIRASLMASKKRTSLMDMILNPAVARSFFQFTAKI
jgi:hypothetical protein